MPRFEDRDSHFNQCEEIMENTGLRCPLIVHYTYMGIMKCHLHHPKMAYYHTQNQHAPRQKFNKEQVQRDHKQERINDEWSHVV